VILQQRHDEANLLDRVIDAMRSVMQRVIAKLEHVWQMFLEGGYRGLSATCLLT
jgi:hypothetical protein